MNRTRSLVAVATLSLVAAFLARADAGASSSHPVRIYEYSGSPGQGEAWGTMLDTRTTADGIAYLGCDRHVRTGAAADSGGCCATTSTGVARCCHTSDTGLLDRMETVERNSFLYFGWNPDGTCQYFGTHRGSAYGVGQQAAIGW